MSIWDTSNATYVDISTPDLNDSTLGIELRVTVSGGNVEFWADVNKGSWNISISTRITI
jgi:hypothetical protein